MDRRQQLNLLQQEVLNSNQTLFWILIFGLDGIIMRNHLIKLVTDANIKIFIDIKLLRQTKVGRNVVYIVTKPAFNYFELYTKTVIFKGSKLIRSSLIAEIYISKGIDMERIKRQIQIGNIIFYEPKSNVNLMNRIYNFLVENKICADTSFIKQQLILLQERQQSISRRRKGKKGNEIITKVQEDLFTLSCKNIYISDVRFNYKEKNLHFSVYILDTHNMVNKKIADYIEIAIKSIEEMFYPVNVTTTIFLYSHRDITSAMKSDILKKLFQKKEFAGRENYIVDLINIKGFNNYNKLFSGINVKNIL